MLISAIIKDTQLLLRDRGALGSLFLLPIIFVVAFGSMFGSSSSDEKPRELAVYYPQGSARAESVVTAIRESGAFTPRREPTAERVRKLVADDTVHVGLILPAGFDPASGVPGEIAIDLASSPRFRGPIEGALRGIVTHALHGGPPAPVLVAKSPPGLAAPLPDVSGFQLSVPGNAVLFGFFLALTVALSFSEERRTGTWRRLLAAPVRRPTLLIAKLVPWFLVGLIQFAFLFGVGAGAFHMRIAGSVPALIVLTATVVMCAIALGLFIASFGGTEKQLGSIGSICLLVMGLLGGAMVPRLTMPETMQHLGLVTPHAWALDGYYALLIRSGSGFADIATPVAALCGFTLVFGVIGVLRFRWN